MVRRPSSRSLGPQHLLPAVILLLTACSGPWEGPFIRSFEASAPSEIEVPTMAWADYQALVDRTGASDQILVVNFWATWCVPCVEEFPELMRIQRDYWDRGVRLATVSMDELDVLEEKVKPFLFEQEAVGARYFMGTDWPQDFQARLSESWWGGIPQTFVYDVRGELRASLTGKQTYEQFQEAVEAALERVSGTE